MTNWKRIQISEKRVDFVKSAVHIAKKNTTRDIVIHTAHDYNLAGHQFLNTALNEYN